MANDGDSKTGIAQLLSSLPTWAWSAVAGLVALLILVALAWSLTGTDDASSLALLVLGGLVVLILALAGLVALFHGLNLIDRNQSLWVTGRHHTCPFSIEPIGRLRRARHLPVWQPVVATGCVWLAAGWQAIFGASSAARCRPAAYPGATRGASVLE